MSASNFALNGGGECYGKLRTAEVCFGEQKMRRTQVSEWFSKSKSGATSAENAQHARHPLMSKAIKNVDQVKDRVRNFIWVSSEHFERQSEHALSASGQQKQNCVNMCLDHQGRL
jgi:CRISPR/Cas system CMR-associated protein Cmr5 small subunit